MSPIRVDKEEKRRVIAQAAVDVFGRIGFDRARIQDVARAAGVGKGTVYEYFRDKEALMAGAVDVLFADFAEDLVSGLAGLEPLEALRKMSRTAAEILTEMGPVYTFFMEYVMYISRRPERAGPLREMLLGFREAVRNLLEQAIERGDIGPGIDCEWVAAVIAAWYDGAAFHWMLLPDRVHIEAMSNCFVDLMLRGLEAGEADKC